MCTHDRTYIYHRKEAVLIKNAVVKRSNCIIECDSTLYVGMTQNTVYSSSIIAKRFDCTLVYGSTTKGDVVKRSDCILDYY